MQWNCVVCLERYYFVGKELQTLTLGVNRGSVHLDAAPADSSDADMREALAQRCHELDTQVCLCYYYLHSLHYLFRIAWLACIP